MGLSGGDATDEEIKGEILWKLYKMHAGKSRHVYESDVPKGMPPQLHKRIMRCLKELRREGLVVEFPHGGEHVFTFNMNRLEEIKARIGRRNRSQDEKDNPHPRQLIS